MTEKSFDVDTLQIPEQEKENIRELQKCLAKAAKNLSHKLETQIVGGAVEKLWPRQDIDLSCTILDIQKGTSVGYAPEQAEATFKVLQEISEKATKDDVLFQIIDTKPPHLDPEFASHGILAHEGSIVVKPLNGTPIELVNHFRK